jgi:immunoglobulin-binding protein 1
MQKDRKPVTGDDEDDFTLIKTLLKSPSLSSNGHDDAEDDESLRTLSILVVKLYFLHAHAQLKSMDEELELLRQAKFTQNPYDFEPSGPSDDTWRLDQLGPKGFSSNGPLIDSDGKVAIFKITEKSRTN